MGNQEADFRDHQAILADKFHDELIRQLYRIADSQEKLLQIAEEARAERKDMANKMKEAFKRPLDIPPAQGVPGA